MAVSNDLQRTLEHLSRLISFDTTSSRSNLALVGYVESYLTELGIAVETISNGDGSKASLLAQIGPEARGGVILSAHSDVVPVEGQSWTYDPFRMTVENGRAYGRGACDMKGFFAAVLAAAPAFLSASLRAPLYFAFSYDEEVGCAGVAPLIAHLKDRLHTPCACIVGEPSLMAPVTAHTGKQIFECEFFGTPMHSSLAPQGRNAIWQAAKVLQKLSDFATELSLQKAPDIRLPIEHPTLNVGTIKGGEAANIVAEYCTFVVEYRYPLGTAEDALRDKLKAVFSQIPEVEGRFQETASYPAFSAPAGSSAIGLVTEITGHTATSAVNYGTEAGLFAQAGIDTIVIGPGDIRQAHQPDEFITLSQLTACNSFLQELAGVMSGGAKPCQSPT